MYETKDEFNQKLLQCVVLFNSNPVIIQEASGKTKEEIKLNYYNLKSKKGDVALASESGWDFKSLGSRLGYTNVDFGEDNYRQALYLRRMAVRQASSTQGLSQRNVKYDQLRADPVLNLGAYKLSWSQVTNGDFFINTLERKFPSLRDLRDFFRKTSGFTSRAFNERFAVSKANIGPFYLEYRGDNIGYSDDLDRFKIGDEYAYLVESLEHIGVRIA